MKKYRLFIQIAVLAAVVVVGVFAIAGNMFSPKEELPQVGGKAPNVTLKNMDGETVQLDDYKGQHVILNFWGTFCEPCVREMPLLQQYHDEYEEQGAVVVGVNLDEPFATVRSFIRNHDVTFPILLDDDTVRRRFGVISYPTTFFIRPDGTIQDRHAGELVDEQLSYYMHRLLSNG